MLNMPLRDPQWGSTGISKPFENPSSSVRSPEDTITLWQWVSVSWMAPLIKIGYERQLHDEDVWFLAYEFQHSRLHEQFRRLTGTVFVRIFKANGLDLIITTGLGVLETSAELAEPILLKQLLAALARESPDTRTALTYAGITLFGRLVRAQSGVFSLWYQRRNYERTRGEMITMIYEKTLRRKAFTFPSGGQMDGAKPSAEELPPSPTDIASSSTTFIDTESEGNDDLTSTKVGRSRFSWITSFFRRKYKKIKPPTTGNKSLASAPEPPASTGKILNLLRNDVYEVAQRFWEFPWIATKPLNFIVSIVLIWHILGPASLSGIVILIAGMGLNVFLMRFLLAIERVRRQITDSKLQRTSQFVESIRHLRWYDWQGAWLDRIMETRQAELMKRVTSDIVRKTISMINSLTAYLFPAAGFLVYTLVTGHPLTVDVAFPALELFSMLQNSLRELPDLVTVWLNAMVAMDRIEKFMLEPDKEDVDEEDDAAGTVPPGELEIMVHDASFSWPGSERKVLRNVALTCKPGLTVVCGRVGAGKTALLQAFMGELDQHGGDKAVPHEMIGYCAQTPWLESMSIRENILFCSRYDRVRFDAVLEACCLKDDLEKFKAKDSSLIGENGIGLSGGQKARVALARAIYSRARILLLDDPIAALDHHTATRILHNLFSDKGSLFMAGRLVVLVTHRVDIATRYADQMLEVFPGGRVGVLDKEALQHHEEDLEHLMVSTAPARRPGSASSSEVEADEAVPDKFIEEERRVHGGVLATVYWQYVKAGSLAWWVALVVLFVLYRVARVGYFWFLKEWGEGYSRESESTPFNVTEMLQQHIFGEATIIQRRAISNGWIDLGDYLPSPSVDVRPWLWWFLAISMAQVLAQTLADVALVVIVYKAGKGLFERAMHRVSNATFRFYDVTPVGRLMNRLTSDMGTIDGQIANRIMLVGWYSVGWLSSIAVIATATPLFLVMSIMMTVLFVFVFHWFLPTSQSLRRLEMVSLSPLMSNFGALVEGLTTVRAFRASAHFQQRIISTTDAFQKMDHIYWSLQAWLQYRFDMLSSLTTFALTATAVLTGLSGGTVGFVLAAASNFVQSTHSLCRRYGEMQMEFVSVERVVELLELEQEPQGSLKPPASWPTCSDDIVFEHATLRYAPELDPVLMDVNLRIPSGANVAVTGRTGSGKSTLALSLLGTLHPDVDSGGTIRIGSVDLASVDKQALRRNITFVAQDPVLFPGTLRDNLDPLDEHGETERAGVLERVLGGQNGSSSASGAEFTLDSPVDAGGKNLSQGQRQLVGLGRAILRRSPVVVMDEATASIDAATAGYIQQLLREELKQSTVITIAHKKEAVKDADFEVVLAQGRILRAGPVDVAVAK